MIRTPVLALVALLGLGSPAARADTLPVLVGLPDSYTPGTPFTFEVRVPRLFSFTAFSVDLIFATDVPNPSLFVSSAAPAVAPGGRYVFPSNANFQSGSTIIAGSNEVLLTFRGSTTPGVIAVPGSNDTLARVTVTPGLTLIGPITVSVGGDTTFDANFESGTPPAPAPVVVPQVGGGEPPQNPIPAPPGLVLAAVGGLLLCARRHFARA